jgi:hypothetical protein
LTGVSCAVSSSSVSVSSTPSTVVLSIQATCTHWSWRIHWHFPAAVQAGIIMLPERAWQLQVSFNEIKIKTSYWINGIRQL